MALVGVGVGVRTLHRRQVGDILHMADNTLDKGHSAVPSETLGASAVAVHNHTRGVVVLYVAVGWGLWMVGNVPPHLVGPQCLQKRSH